MLKAAKREKKTPKEIAEFYTKHFFDDMQKLNVEKAAYYPRATAHVPQMIKIISELINKGLAYVVNGSVFYDVTKFPDYGKLSGIKIDELKVGARLEEHPDKRNPYDFSLWLKAPKEHILKWDSPWSLGYPGWHIECSAMGMEYLGETMDIHTGGEDHIFPHHENEIAQSEGFSGKTFSNFWIHNRFLLVDGHKMSKSKNNFYILKDIEKKGYDPMVFRLLVISAHYRSQLNFTWQSLDQAKSNLARISEWTEKLKSIADGSSTSIVEAELPLSINEYQKRFNEAMDDDLNTPLAISVLFELITETNRLLAENAIGVDDAKEILFFWNKINRVLGLVIKKEEIPQEITDLAEERKIARAEKDFKKSDQLRKKIDELGYAIEDLKDNKYILKRND
jgi:cysteinyl-tRNA synthetase